LFGPALNFSVPASGGGWTASDIETFVTWWTGLNYVRTAVGGVGWLCALRALSL
jgi:hypothetical protein